MVDENRLATKLDKLDYLHLEYLRDLQRSGDKEPQHDKIIHRVNRCMLKILSFMTCIEFCTSHKHHGWIKISQASVLTETGSVTSKTSQPISWYSKLVDNLATNLMICVHYLFVVHLTVALYYQYSYDFDLMRLMRLREMVESNAEMTNETIGADEQRLISRMHDTRAVLSTIGAPYSHLSITIETIYLCILALSFITFTAMLINFRFIKPYNLHVINENLNYKFERKLLKQLIREQVDQFLASERLFACLLTQRDCVRWLLQPNHYRFSQQNDLDFADQIDACASTRLCLVEMLSCGSLTPYNRSLNWFELRTKIALAYQAVTAFYATIFFIALISIAFTESDQSRPLTTSDMLINASSIGIMALVCFAILLQTTFSIMAGLDQIFVVDKLLQLIKRCIQSNSVEFHARKHTSLHSSLIINKFVMATGNSRQFQSAAERRMSCQNIVQASALIQSNNSNQFAVELNNNKANKMNTNLLFILMQYKVFVAQANPVMKTLDTVLVVVSAVLLLIPVIARFHMPYVSVFQTNDIRLLSAGLSFAILLPSNLTVLPLCYFHSRVESLYRALSSLRAHVTEIESHPAGNGIYNQHAVLMLSKELSHPDRFIGQFKGRLASLSGTYTTWVKVHFWWGLIVISILADSKLNGQGFLDSLFNDPLNVF